MIEADIKNFAKVLGFEFCGIAPVKDVEKLVNEIEKWIENGYNATMKWMEKKLAMKEKLKPFKSCIVVLKNYYTPVSVKGFARYAIFEDYHVFMRRRLRIIEKFLEKKGARNFYSSVDASIVSERYFAYLAGAGFIGKSTMLISPVLGGFCFIGEVFSDIELDYDSPLRISCGRCTKCIDACPTGAIDNYILDANKCISYLTIEHRGIIPDELKPFIQSWIFGCDICIEVCPWNRFARTANAIKKVVDIEPEKILEMNLKEFNEYFKDTNILRTGYNRIIRNILIAAGNGFVDVPLEKLNVFAQSEDEGVRDAAFYALKCASIR